MCKQMEKFLAQNLNKVLNHHPETLVAVGGGAKHPLIFNVGQVCPTYIFCTLRLVNLRYILAGISSFFRPVNSCHTPAGISCALRPKNCHPELDSGSIHSIISDTSAFPWHYPINLRRCSC